MATDTDGTALAARVPRRADRGPQLHERLVPVARPLGRHELPREGPGAPLQGGAGGDLLQEEQPREHALDVAVHQGLGLLVGDGADGAGRVLAHARQRAHVRGGRGEAPPVLLLHDPRGGVQRPRTTVVAETGPLPQDVLLRRLRQGRHRGEAPEEAHPALGDDLHAGLLEHHLADPDAVGIARPPPWQVPRRLAIPGEQVHVERADQRRLERGVGGRHRADCRRRCGRALEGVGSVH